MLVADIKGKLSLHELYSEDFLTSSVFSAFMYLDEKWIQKFINQSINIEGGKLYLELVNPQYDFWPHFAANKQSDWGTEPDVVIYSGNTAIIIEAKNYSGKSGEGVIEGDTTEGLMVVDSKRIADQLGREYFIGRNSILESIKEIDEDVFTIDNFVLIFLTRHATLPRNAIEESINAIVEISPKEKVSANQKIFWLNWQKAVPIFEEIVETKSKNTFEYKISQNMLDFLERRDLGIFSGFNFFDKFYDFISESKEISNKKHLFYKKIFKPYWIFLDKLKSFDRISKDTVFYNIVDLPYWNFLKNDFKFHKGSVFYNIIEKPYWEFITLGFDFKLKKEIFYKE